MGDVLLGLQKGLPPFHLEGSQFLSSYCTSRVFSPTFRLLSIKFCLTIMIDSVFVFQGLPVKITSFPSSMDSSLGYQSLWPGVPRCVSIPLLLQQITTNLVAQAIQIILLQCQMSEIFKSRCHKTAFLLEIAGENSFPCLFQLLESELISPRPQPPFSKNHSLFQTLFRSDLDFHHHTTFTLTLILCLPLYKESCDYTEPTKITQDTLLISKSLTLNPNHICILPLGFYGNIFTEPRDSVYYTGPVQVPTALATKLFQK